MSKFLFLIGSLLLGGMSAKAGNWVGVVAAACFLVGTAITIKEYPDVIERPSNSSDDAER